MHPLELILVIVRALSLVIALAAIVGFVVLLPKLVPARDAAHRPQRARYFALIAALSAIAFALGEQILADTPIGARTVATSVAMIVVSRALVLTWRNPDAP